MSTDYRALCEELEDAYTWCIEEFMTAPAEEDTLIQRARAALTQPKPVAQEVMTVNELAAIIYEVDPRTDTLCSPCMSSEDLAEGLLSHPRFHAPSTAPAIQPVPVAPTGSALEDLFRTALEALPND
jgi:hypothetical protein